MSAPPTAVPVAPGGRPPYWLWPFRWPARVSARYLSAGRRLGGALGRGPLWALAGLFAGVAPLAAAPLVGWGSSTLLSAGLAMPLLAAAAVRNSLPLGLTVIAAAFGSHSALTIALVARDPAGMAPLFPAGAAYWGETRDWIVTGQSREYSPGWWVPAHAQLLAAMVFFTYTSLGLLTLWHGFHEVDLMNFYVGNLLARSENPWLALAVGWHPWSVCRGLGFGVITFEVVSWSVQRMTGAALSTPAERRRRWLLGLTFLVLDGVLKYTLLDAVRRVLAGNLLAPG